MHVITMRYNEFELDTNNGDRLFCKCDFNDNYSKLRRDLIQPKLLQNRRHTLQERIKQKQKQQSRKCNVALNDTKLQY